jgi:hypothetical protein
MADLALQTTWQQPATKASGKISIFQTIFSLVAIAQELGMPCNQQEGQGLTRQDVSTIGFAKPARVNETLMNSVVCCCCCCCCHHTDAVASWHGCCGAYACS